MVYCIQENINYMKKIHNILAATFSAIIFTLPAVALAQRPNLGAQINANLAYGTLTGLGTRDIRAVIMTIINVILGFLSIVAVLIVLWGGFKWMTAGGNEDQIDEAKKIIIAGIVGLGVIFTAYAIALFVVRSLVNSTI